MKTRRRTAARRLSAGRMGYFSFPLAPAGRCFTRLAADDFIFPVQHGDPRAMRLRFFESQLRKVHDRKQIADFSAVRGCAVQLDNALARRSIDYVGFKTFAVL